MSRSPLTRGLRPRIPRASIASAVSVSRSASVIAGRARPRVPSSVSVSGSRLAVDYDPTGVRRADIQQKVQSLGFGIQGAE